MYDVLYELMYGVTYMSRFDLRKYVHIKKSDHMYNDRTFVWCTDVRTKYGRIYCMTNRRTTVCKMYGRTYTYEVR